MQHINPLHSMWVVVDSEGYPLYLTQRPSFDECIEAAIEACKFTWPYLQELGYSCVPVNVQYKLLPC